MKMTFGGRRYALTLMVLAIATLLCWFDKLSGEQWVTITIAIVAAYLTANTMQKNQELKSNAVPLNP